MNTIDRHIVSYIFGCLSGDFGDNFESTKQILAATEHHPENPFLQAVLYFVKEYGADDEGIREAIAKTAMEYFANPKKYQREDVAIYSKVGSNYFFTVHRGDKVVGVIVTNNFECGKQAILDKCGDAKFIDAQS